ncbi:MAG: SCP2 sterol-binding domain-containing protein, partial [Vallitaleaceae bacterium]|nr:SCP2 sterol-binding domain-containing protein [Vallitaleaceae bacterium]
MKKSRIVELYKDCSALITEQTQEIHNLVLGDGNFNADVMFIGDMPSTEEEALGSPFVGKTAKTFNSCLEALGLKKEDVYRTHIVKYRPYKINERSGRILSRSPKKEEIDFFLTYLQSEINVIAPKIIVTLGTLPLRALMEDNNLQIKSEHGKVRKKFINDRAYTVLPISQPNLTNNDEEDTVDEDIEVLKKLIAYVGTDKELPEEELEKYVIEPKKVKMKPQKMPAPKGEDEKKNSKLKTILIYGGDGYADDPTLVALDRIGNVLAELNTRIIRFDLYKEDYNLQDFLTHLSDAQAVVIATTVEWFGIGGHLQLFLDKCWKYGNRKHFDNTFLFGVVISKQGYERDTYNHLIKSWELLGGVEGTSLCTCIKKSIDLETNQTLLAAIDKKTEEFYRIAHQNRTVMPSSIRENKVLVEVPTQKTEHWEHEVFSHKAGEENPETFIPNYDAYIEKQQKDISDISNIFKQKLTHTIAHKAKTEPQIFNECFVGSNDPIQCKIQWNITDKRSKNFVMEIKTKKINTSFGNVDDHTIILNLEEVILQKIIEGKMTIQRAFMTGEIKSKGDFTVLYKLDALFKFN